MKEKFDFSLPTEEYLKFNNIFSGSLGEFNYKIFPKLEEGMVLVVVWKGRLCFEKSELLFRENFNLEERIKEKINLWLNEKINSEYF